MLIEWHPEEFIKELEAYIDDNCEIIAKQIAADAKSTSAFKDETSGENRGKLRRSIRAKKSKYKDGGWIAQAGRKGAKQAWLVEHGHGGPHPAPAHPYLRPALDKNISAAKALFGVR
jgi:HK97 gp10 family phage protein